VSANDNVIIRDWPGSSSVQYRCPARASWAANEIEPSVAGGVGDVIEVSPVGQVGGFEHLQDAVGMAGDDELELAAAQPGRRGEPIAFS
jgi:hypothetical protein